jgi:phage/plasmid-associated DNA primase
MHSSYQLNGSFTPSSKTSPCPVCDRTKDGDCRISLNGKLVLCHRNINHERTPQAVLNSWYYLGETTDRRCGKYILKEDDRDRKPIRPAQTRCWEYPARDGSKLVRVKRVDDGKGKKNIWQERWDGKDWVKKIKGIVDRADIPPYRYAEVKKAIAENKLIFIAEGEPAVDLLWNLGLAATCNIGGSGGWKSSDTSDLAGAQVVMVPDRDEPGIKHADSIAQDFPDAQWLYPYPESPAWDNLPKLGGLDIGDWIADKKLEGQDLLNFLSPRPRTRKNVVCQKYDGNSDDYIPETALAPEQNFVQKAESALYSDAHYVTVGGQFYRFDGSYYELQSEAQEKRRIGDWLNTHVENVKGRYTYNRAKSSNVAEILNWITARKGIDPKDINPDGLNCSNGVVKINPDGSHTFTSHNPDRVYTYVGCKYDPDADPTDCDRLLECLSPLHREVFLRTAAAALAVKLVRKKIGRKLKGLLCYGDGNNGKDTLRAALAAVLGRGMTGKTLSDFRDYDKGRKFNIAGIEEALCNWSSENASTVKLDSLQSLKQFITGDPLDIERKGKDSFQCHPSAIFLANCNKLPSITGGMEAITSRYSILKFEKTFVVGADPSRGELEADPRFKDDPDFIRDRIAPALLNKLLERLPLVLTEGIDHSVTDDAMREAQEESRHLWGFAREIGIESQPNGRIYIKDLWEQLQRWYEGTGVLEVERTGDKQKLVWNDLPNEWDKPVKAPNQVYARFCELFPKIRKQLHTEGSASDPRKAQAYLSGVGYANSQKSAEHEKTVLLALLPCSDNETALLSKAEVSQETLTLKEDKASKAISLGVEEILQAIHQLPDSERQKLVELLAQSQPSSEQSATAEPDCEQLAIGPAQNHPPRPGGKGFAEGDRVQVVKTDAAHYLGVKGTVAAAYFGGSPIEQWQYVVDFDAPICNSDFSTFTAGELEELAEQ